MPLRAHLNLDPDALAASLAAERDRRPVASSARPARKPPAATADPRDVHEPPPERVRERLKQNTLVPSALSVDCPSRHAPAGEHCYGTGVCWKRVVARASAR